jgi:hypothetical protein
MHELDDHDYLPRRLLTADLLESSWTAAKSILARSEEEPEWNEPTPTSVFTAILRNQQADVVAVAGGVILGWFVENRQATDIAPRTVSLLLKDVVDEDRVHAVGRETGFRAFMLDRPRMIGHGTSPRKCTRP